MRRNNTNYKYKIIRSSPPDLPGGAWGGQKKNRLFYIYNWYKNVFPLLILSFAGFVILVPSCKKDPPVNSQDYGYDYFPFETGKYIIYDVDSIVHNDFTDTIDTYRYQIREYWESSFLDNAGRNTIRIERYKRDFIDTVPYDSIPWILIDVWHANRTNTTAEKVEENIRYVKLNIPAEEGKSWNGNSYNTLGEEEYFYEDVNIPRTVGNITFDSTLFVTQINTENLIAKKFSAEIYAKNIGMIYKEIIDVESDKITGAPLMERIAGGVEYKMTVNSYGSN